MFHRINGRVGLSLPNGMFRLYGCRYVVMPLRTSYRISNFGFLRILSFETSMFVSVSVCEHISGITRPNITGFLCVYRGPVLFWRRCNTLCASDFMNDVILEHTGQA